MTYKQKSTYHIMEEHVKIVLWVKTLTTKDGSKKQGQNREGTSNNICKGKEPADIYRYINKKIPTTLKYRNFSTKNKAKYFSN